VSVDLDATNMRVFRSGELLLTLGMRLRSRTLEAVCGSLWTCCGPAAMHAGTAAFRLAFAKQQTCVCSAQVSFS
jgi:hypothetical protein